MDKRLLIVARDFNTAQHWAKDTKISLGQWVYASSFHNIQGNPGSDYVLLPKWELRPDAQLILAKLNEYNCSESSEF